MLLNGLPKILPKPKKDIRDLLKIAEHLEEERDAFELQMLTVRQENLDLLKNLAKIKHEYKKVRNDNTSYQNMLAQYSKSNGELMDLVTSNE